MSPLSWLKPDMGKKAKHKTQIKKKTLNPEFNEVRLPRFVNISCVRERKRLPTRMPSSAPKKKLSLVGQFESSKGEVMSSLSLEGIKPKTKTYALGMSQERSRV